MSYLQIQRSRPRHEPKPAPRLAKSERTRAAILDAALASLCFAGSQIEIMNCPTPRHDPAVRCLLCGDDERMTLSDWIRYHWKR